MAKEKTLGPGVTYHDLDGAAPVVTVAGVTFADGDTIDMVDELGEKRAGQLLAKLAGNPFFDVEGNTADHSDRIDALRADAGAKARKPQRKPELSKAVKRKIKEDDAEKGIDTDVDGDGATDEPAPDADLPDDVQTPDQPALENASRPRLARRRAS